MNNVNDIRYRTPLSLIRQAVQVFKSEPTVARLLGIPAPRLPDWREGGLRTYRAKADVLILQMLASCEESKWIDQRINERAELAARIKACAHEGKVRVVESGRDCDGVEYSGGSGREIEATVAAFHLLENRVHESADGPFRLSVVPWDFNEPYESRDLVMEARENGHPHSIVSRFS